MLYDPQSRGARAYEALALEFRIRLGSVAVDRDLAVASTGGSLLSEEA